MSGVAVVLSRETLASIEARAAEFGIQAEDYGEMVAAVFQAERNHAEFCAAKATEFARLLAEVEEGRLAGVA